MVGSVPVGGDAPVTVQTMTNTPTSDAAATIAQIRRCEEAGVDIIRVSCPDPASTAALRQIVRESGVGPDDVVVEVGPGLGSLTLALLAVARRVDPLDLSEGAFRPDAEADRATLRVSPSARWVSEYYPVESATDIEQGPRAGGLEVVLPVAQPQWLVGLMLRLGPEAELVAPEALREAGALGGASDHGVSKSLYGSDPDGNEFEIMWRVPREAWGEYEQRGAVMPLDIEAEVTGLEDDDPQRAHRIRGQVAVASTPGRVRRVRLLPVARPC